MRFSASPALKLGGAAAALVALAVAWRYAAPSTAHAAAFSKAMPAGGAEDADFFAVRAASRHSFTTLLYIFSGSPHAGVLGARYIGGMAKDSASNFDVAVFGADEAAAKSPWHPLKALLTPGLMAAQYVQHFHDTNPYVAASLIATFVMSDLRWATNIYFGASVSVLAALTTYLLSTVMYLAFGSVLHLLLFVTPSFLVDWVFYAILVCNPFFAAYRLYMTLTQLRLALAAGGRWGIVDAAKRGDIVDAVTVADAALLTPGFFSERYTIVSHINDGGFGVVSRGVNKASQEGVAIKRFKVQEPEKVGSIVQRLVGQLRAADPGAARSASQAVRAMLKLANDTAKINAMHEVRGLLAARMVGSPNLLSLRTAHKEDEATVVIVTQLVGPPWVSAMSGASVAEKLKTAQRALLAIAALHEHGIVHRDIKPDNINMPVDAKNETAVPVILDLGIALLPGVEDHFPGCCTPHYVPPEFFGAQTSRAIGTGSTSLLGAPHDVWALAITILQLLDGTVDIQRHPIFRMSLRRGGNAETWMAVAHKMIAAWSAAEVAEMLQDCGIPAGSPLHSLLSAMLHPNPALRITARDAARHHAFGRAVPALLQTGPHRLDATGLAASLGRFLGLRRKRNVSRLSLLRNSYVAAINAILSEGSLVTIADGADAHARELQARIKAFGGSHLGVADFERLLNASGVVLPVSHAELFELLDTSGDKKLDKREALMGLAFVLAPTCDERTKLRLAFDAFDLDGSGELSLAELRDFLDHFGPTFSKEVGGAEAMAALARLHSRTDELFAQLDKDHSGSLTFDEFEAGVHKSADLRLVLFGSDADVAYKAAEAGKRAASGSGAGGAAAAPGNPSLRRR
jgi:serine/threonine protein kinase/Ca2+-binding EF-hand superfamily protein